MWNYFSFFSTFLELLKKIPPEKNVSWSKNREEWWLVVEDRAGNRQQITDSLGSLGRREGEADNNI